MEIEELEILEKTPYHQEEELEEKHKIKLTIPQTDFIESKEKFPLFLAGYGSGKSVCAAVGTLNDCQIGGNVGCYAPTYDLLSLITIEYIEELLTLGNIPYKFNKSRKIFDLENHGHIICRSMDNPSRIVGYEVFRSHVDELDTLPKNKAQIAWNKMIGRNRQKVYKIKNDRRILSHYDIATKEAIWKTYLNRICSYTTPEGFMFCYEKWEKEKENNLSLGYKIYRASTYSNLHNLPDDYIDTLASSYPAELFDSYVNAIFVNLIGGRVYSGFDRVLNHTDEIYKVGEEIYVGMDFNVTRGAAIIHVLRNGLPCAVDEIHNAYDTDEQITYLKENYSKSVINVYPDTAGKNRTSSNAVETDIYKLENAGFYCFYQPNHPPIKDRVFSLGAMICNAKGDRRYKVNTKMCPEFTLCLEQQIWDENGLPDKKAGLDHKPDAAGYYVYEEFPIIKPAPKVTIVKRY